MPDLRPIPGKAVAAILIASAGASFLIVDHPMPVEPRTDPATSPEVVLSIESCVAAKPEIEERARDPRFQYDHRLLRRVEAVHQADPAQCGEFAERVKREMDAAATMVIAIP